MRNKYLHDKDILLLQDQYVTLSDLFELPTGSPVELDVGCGTGELSLELARRYPNSTILAADIMMNRIRRVVNKSFRMHLNNVKCLRVEARNLLTIILPDASIDRLHIVCPDPWPKKRHRQNRLMVSDFMVQIHRVLKPNGIFHFASDDEEYLALGLKNIQESGLFQKAPDGALSDIADIHTEFEQKWLDEGKSVTHTAWVPVPRKQVG